MTSSPCSASGLGGNHVPRPAGRGDGEDYTPRRPVTKVKR
jgi:hypothetical protein